MMITELLPVHDDALVDFDPTFAVIDHEVVRVREQAEITALLLDVDWLVEEMCADTARAPGEPLDISLELTPEAGGSAVAGANVAEVA